MKIVNALFRGGRRFQVDTEDFRNFINLAAKEIVARLDDGSTILLRIPVGAKSDLASTPPILWVKLLKQWLTPFGKYAPDAYAHDSAYQATLERWDDLSQAWKPAMLTKDESDDLLKALMVSGGVEQAHIDEIYEGVHIAGWRPFREDRQEAEVQ